MTTTLSRFGSEFLDLHTAVTPALAARLGARLTSLSAALLDLHKLAPSFDQSNQLGAASESLDECILIMDARVGKTERVPAEQAFDKLPADTASSFLVPRQGVHCSASQLSKAYELNAVLIQAATFTRTAASRRLQGMRDLDLRVGAAIAELRGKNLALHAARVAATRVGVADQSEAARQVAHSVAALLAETRPTIQRHSQAPAAASPAAHTGNEVAKSVLRLLHNARTPGGLVAEQVAPVPAGAVPAGASMEFLHVGQVTFDAHRAGRTAVPAVVAPAAATSPTAKAATGATDLGYHLVTLDPSLGSVSASQIASRLAGRLAAFDAAVGALRQAGADPLVLASIRESIAGAQTMFLQRAAEGVPGGAPAKFEGLRTAASYLSIKAGIDRKGDETRRCHAIHEDHSESVNRLMYGDKLTKPVPRSSPGWAGLEAVNSELRALASVFFPCGR